MLVGMDHLSDILSRKDFDQPAESVAIRSYVRREFDRDVEVRVELRTIIISAPSASFVNALRLRIVDLQKTANTEKRILFRIK